jgi:alpha-D-xyloside xylohydrolase
MLYYDNLRYRLMPYIYSMAGKTYFNNYTIMRGLVMDFEADTNVYNIADQYMYGPALMVCPVTEYKARSRKVYLPEASGWYDLYTGKHYNGGQTLDAEAPIERIPVYVKEGSIIPFGPAIQYADEPTDGSVILYVYEGADGKFTLYEDENVNYDYEKGIYSTIPISYNEANHSLTIGERKGTFPGMHEKRSVRIISVNKNSPEALNFEKEGKTVEYDGQSQTIQLN